MRLLLVHLSDIHLKTEDDEVLRRVDQIARAAASVDYEVDACLIALTGDIAQSGAEPEYLLALELVDGLVKALQRELQARTKFEVPVQVVVVPGNHDCSLGSPSPARDTILDAVRSGAQSLREPSISAIAVGPQAYFHQFREAVQSVPATSADGGDGRLAWGHRLEHGGVAVDIVCLNSAVMSRVPDREGTLFVDPTWVGKRAKDAAVRLALMHHPPNWMVSRVSRELHRQLQQQSDVILTGHEHFPDKRAITDTTESSTEHIEGGVLQDREDPSNSSFAVLLIDAGARRQKFAVFAWTDSGYELSERTVFGEDGGGLAWTAVQNDRFRVAEEWRPSDSILAFLADPGVQLAHRNRAKVTLSDIFVPPSLHEFDPTTTSDGDEIAGPWVAERLFEAGKVVVVGDDVSGKTSLSKMLFLAFHRLGAVPLLLGAGERPPATEKLYGFLEEKLAEQYGVPIARVQQMERPQRAIIIDDWDRVALSPRARHDVLERLAKFADHVVVFVNELWAQLADSAVVPHAEFRHFRIKPLSPPQRASIIDRWFTLDSPAEDQAVVARQIRSAGATINQLIGKNFVPSYPITVITVLQAMESQLPIDTRASTQGYLYETLINAAIARGGHRDDIDVVRGFLSRLAGQMFEQRQFSIDLSNFRSIYRGYEADYGIRRDPDDLLRSLCGRQLLRHVGDTVHFRYRHIYYYFAANCLALSIHEPETQATVRELARSLHVTESANTLLFLAHLVRHPALADALVEAAREVQAGLTPARLEDDVNMLDALVAAAAPPEFIDEVDPAKQRLALAQEGADDGDGAEARIEPGERGWTANPLRGAVALDPLARLNAGIKVIQILGQLLKNSPGTIQLDVKQRLMRELVGTGLALLEIVQGLYRTHSLQILAEFAALVRVRTPEIDDEKLWEKARDLVLFLAGGATFGLIKRMSQSMGARDLVSTYQEVLREDSSTARMLVELSLSLDSANGFPEERVKALSQTLAGRPFAKRLLVQLVLRHFAIFPEDFRLKQRVAEQLGVKYQRLVASHRENAIVRR